MKNALLDAAVKGQIKFHRPGKHLRIVQYPEKILKLSDLTHGYPVRAHRDKNCPAQIQKLEYFVNSVPDIQDHSLIGTVDCDLLQKARPVLPGSASDIQGRLHRGNIIQDPRRLHHTVQLHGKIPVSLAHKIQKVA